MSANNATNCLLVIGVSLVAGSLAALFWLAAGAPSLTAMLSGIIAAFFGALIAGSLVPWDKRDRP